MVFYNLTLKKKKLIKPQFLRNQSTATKRRKNPKKTTLNKQKCKTYFYYIGIQ